MQCEQQTLWNAAVSAADQAPSRRLGGGETPPDQPARTPAFLALALLIAIFTVPKIRRELAIRREVRDIVRSEDIRARVDAKLNVDPAVLLAERSDRGDAYRSLRSLLDAMERDRDIGVDTKKEIARRVREVIA